MYKWTTQFKPLLCCLRVNPAIVFLYYFSTVAELALKKHRFELCGPLILGLPLWLNW